MDQPKQVFEVDGKPMVRRAAETALAAGCAPVVVVVGAAGEQVRAALEGLPVQICQNPDWQAGMSTSLKAGLRQAPADAGSAVFFLADQPYLPVEVVRRLARAHAATLHPLAAPRSGGRRMTPTLIDRSLYAALDALTGDQGARSFFAPGSPFQAAWVDWDDPAVFAEFDTIQDWEKRAGEIK
jgi:molybdenum cofactor cytidylyltransferase